MTAEQFAVWLQQTGWSDSEAARQLRVHRSQVLRWKAGQQKIPGPVERLCEMLAG